MDILRNIFDLRNDFILNRDKLPTLLVIDRATYDELFADSFRFSDPHTPKFVKQYDADGNPTINSVFSMRIIVRVGKADIELMSAE